MQDFTALLPIDVLIVGGGSSGSVLAARLSEDPGVNIVLIEAGKRISSRETKLVDDLGRLPLDGQSDLIWSYSSGRVSGCCLGGSSSINGGYFIRATPADIDQWNIDRWSYHEVLQYFTKSESDKNFGGSGHGKSGPMEINRVYSDEKFISACIEVGHEFCADKNMMVGPGVGPVPLNSSAAGVRLSTERTYLRSAELRPNLSVLTRLTVLRVKVKRERVIGVEVLDGSGEVKFIRAERVILCAGAIHTAQILLHSGIGDYQMLKNVGIPVVHHLPGVGTGFSEHPEVVVPVEYGRNDKSSSSRNFALLHTVLNTSDNLEIRPYTVPFSVGILGASDEISRIGIAMMKPSGRGKLAVYSDNPLTALSIHHELLNNSADRLAMESGIAQLQELFSTASMRGAKVLCKDPATLLQQFLSPSQHLTGTAKMGKESEGGSVVDADLKVFGIEGLFIADASILPSIPSRGPHATIIMLAEYAAHLLSR
ncbi:MAG: mycofactocin dehydrogenase MftG [Mycobacteriaceae bacterium]